MIMKCDDDEDDDDEDDDDDILFVCSIILHVKNSTPRGVPQKGCSFSKLIHQQT